MSLKYFIQKLLGRWLSTPEIPEGKTTGFSFVRSERYKTNNGKYVKIVPPFFLHNVEVGDYSVLAYNAHAANVKIGKFCSIGPNFCCGLGLHPTNGISSSAMFYSTSKLNGMTLSKENKYEETKQTFIGNDVYIGANVFVLDGVTISDGAVVGAGAVVTKDIPPYAIALGIPAKVVKYRFDETTIKSLLEKQWWNGTDEDLQQVEKYFWDVEDFLKEMK
jgi:acetyltransferase-like isoleucine patch superfamily enzyme